MVVCAVLVVDFADRVDNFLSYLDSFPELLFNFPTPAGAQLLQFHTHQLPNISSHTMHRLMTRLPLRTALQCRPPTQPLRFPVVPIPSGTPRQSRNFTGSPALYKKKDKGAKKGANPDAEASPAATTTEDPFDLSILHSGISTAISRLKDDLSKLRAGGRFNTATLEGLKVQLSKDSQDVVRLGDLAQVVPKGGRMVTILAAEEQVRPTQLYSIFSAIEVSLSHTLPHCQANKTNPTTYSTSNRLPRRLFPQICP